jgi:hypothetical protein
VLLLLSDVKTRQDKEEEFGVSKGPLRRYRWKQGGRDPIGLGGRPTRTGGLAALLALASPVADGAATSSRANRTGCRVAVEPAWLIFG